MAVEEVQIMCRSWQMSSKVYLKEQLQVAITLQRETKEICESVKTFFPILRFMDHKGPKRLTTKCVQTKQLSSMKNIEKSLK